MSWCAIKKLLTHCSCGDPPDHGPHCELLLVWRPPDHWPHCELLLMWRPPDHGPHCGLLSVDRVQKRSFDSTQSRRWCCQLAEFCGDSMENTHTPPFNGLFSRTTWVSRYQKGKTCLDLNEASNDGVFLGAVASAGPYANNLHLAPDR